MELKSHGYDVEEQRMVLLIVPYGIEISYLQSKKHYYKAFNRTLWN